MDAFEQFGHTIGTLLAPVIVGLIISLPAIILNRRRGGARNAYYIIIAACIAAFAIFWWPGAIIAAVISLIAVWYQTRPGRQPLGP